MTKPNAKKLFIALLLFATAFIASCSTPSDKRDLLGEKRNYLTVSEAWQRVESLDGKQVRVRAFGSFSIWQTLLLCQPASCSCNKTGGELILLEDEYDPEGDRDFYDLAWIYIPESELTCQGNECSMDCFPFDPSIAKEFELSGTLRYNPGPDSDRLILENLDLENSKQLIDEEWIPIDTGLFTIEVDFDFD